MADVCNGKNDCGDNSDENLHTEVCSKYSNCYSIYLICFTINFCIIILEHFKNESCSWPDNFFCHNKVCINANLTCNGQDDCGDFSDEDKCSEYF